MYMEPVTSLSPKPLRLSAFHKVISQIRVLVFCAHPEPRP